MAIMNESGSAHPATQDEMFMPRPTEVCPDGQQHEWTYATSIMFYCTKCKQLKQVLPASLVYD